MNEVLTIDFHGDTLTAIMDDTRGVLVPLRPLVTGMGLDWSAQFRRVQRDELLSGSVAMMATENDRQAICLPIDLVPGFLCRIDAGRIRDEAIRAKVLAYQRECFRVLADACFGREPARDTEVIPPGPTAMPDTALALRLVAAARHTFGQQAAREIWLRVGLPVTPAMMAKRFEPYRDLFG